MRDKVKSSKSKSNMGFLCLCISSLLIVFVSEGGSTNTEAVVQGNLKKRLIGGKSTRISSYPYFVSIELDNTAECGGAIVSAYYVLTAAHCIDGDVSRWNVRAGSQRTGRGGTLHPVDKFTPHPYFYQDPSKGNVNDIGVVRVKNPFIMDRVRQPVKLFNDGEKIKANSMVVIIGVGITQSSVQPRQMRKITIPVVDQAQCREYYKLKGDAPASGTFCAGYEQGGVDTCVGDSGGPVIVDGRLAGIVSFGIGCGLPKLPGVNTEIASFRNWINSQVEF